MIGLMFTLLIFVILLLYSQMKDKDSRLKLQTEHHDRILANQELHAPRRLLRRQFKGYLENVFHNFPVVGIGVFKRMLTRDFPHYTSIRNSNSDLYSDLLIFGIIDETVDGIVKGWAYEDD
ncbi:hypothetical protein SAE01_08180 [Segetibacter aerophilus]|uniref:Uncharacterized protein n=1 Tax=Segetibacter aerophilus TaxID=670293 RepID=A0A512B8N7_9BACT|nr:hypothetical protein SAE01_08180 [Segetibacter aerophilus]